MPVVVVYGKKSHTKCCTVNKQQQQTTPTKTYKNIVVKTAAAKKTKTMQKIKTLTSSYKMVRWMDSCEWIDWI